MSFAIVLEEMMARTIPYVHSLNLYDTSDQQVSYASFCFTAESSFLPNQDSSWDLSLGDILLHSICATDIQNPAHWLTDRQKWEAGRDWHCLHYKYLRHRFLLFLHVSLHCCPWHLSQWQNGGQSSTMTAVMTKRWKLCLLRLSRWIKKSHQLGSGERDLLFCITLVFT